MLANAASLFDAKELAEHLAKGKAKRIPFAIVSVGQQLNVSVPLPTLHLNDYNDHRAGKITWQGATLKVADTLISAGLKKDSWVVFHCTQGRVRSQVAAAAVSKIVAWRQNQNESLQYAEDRLGNLLLQAGIAEENITDGFMAARPIINRVRAGEVLYSTGIGG